jgi:hypothetical protein
MLVITKSPLCEKTTNYIVQIYHAFQKKGDYRKNLPAIFPLNYHYVFFTINHWGCFICFSAGPV